MTNRAPTTRGIRDAVERHPWFVVWISLLPLLTYRAGTLTESDTFWQVRTGILTMSDRSVPTTDPFSWTAAGEPWTLNSWGFNVLLAVAYRTMGLAGVAIASAALVGFAFWLIILLARRLGANPLMTAVIIQLSLVMLYRFLTARPQVIDYIAVLVMVWLLTDLVASRRSSRATVICIGALTIAWVNLHASATIGIGIIAAVTICVFAYRPTRDRAPVCLSALFVSAVAMLANPYGINVIRQSFEVADTSRSSIVEWQHLDFADPIQVVPFLVGLIALIFAVRRRDVVYGAVLASTGIGAISAVRMLPIFALVALPVLASAASTEQVKWYVSTRRLMLTQGAVVWTLIFIAFSAPAAIHIGRPDTRIYSPALVSAIPRHCDVFNSYSVGGFVILKRPDLRVSIDSRNDMYGATKVDAADHAMAHPTRRDLAGAACALVPKSTAMARWLGKSSEWRRAGSDHIAVLYVRR